MSNLGHLILIKERNDFEKAVADIIESIPESLIHGLRLLVSKELNTIDLSFCRTHLQTASCVNSYTSLLWLLIYEAEVNLKSPFCQLNPLDLAQERGHQLAVQTLQLFGSRSSQSAGMLSCLPFFSKSLDVLGNNVNPATIQILIFILLREQVSFEVNSTQALKYKLILETLILRLIEKLRPLKKVKILRDILRGAVPFLRHHGRNSLLEFLRNHRVTDGFTTKATYGESAETKAGVAATLSAHELSRRLKVALDGSDFLAIWECLQQKNVTLNLQLEPRHLPWLFYFGREDVAYHHFNQLIAARSWRELQEFEAQGYTIQSHLYCLTFFERWQDLKTLRGISQYSSFKGDFDSFVKKTFMLVAKDKALASQFSEKEATAEFRKIQERYLSDRAILPLNLGFPGTLKLDTTVMLYGVFPFLNRWDLHHSIAPLARRFAVAVRDFQTIASQNDQLRKSADQISQYKLLCKIYVNAKQINPRVDSLLTCTDSFEWMSVGQRVYYLHIPQWICWPMTYMPSVIGFICRRFPENGAINLIGNSMFLIAQPIVILFAYWLGEIKALDYRNKPYHFPVTSLPYAMRREQKMLCPNIEMPYVEIKHVSQLRSALEKTKEQNSQQMLELNVLLKRFGILFSASESRQESKTVAPSAAKPKETKAIHPEEKLPELVQTSPVIVISFVSQGMMEQDEEDEMQNREEPAEAKGAPHQKKKTL